MCHLIAVILPKVADVDRLIPIAREHHRTLRVFENPQLGAQLPPEVASFITTTGHCDCGTPLGSAHHERARSALFSEKEIAELRRKGWSAAKIERWIEQKVGVRTRAERVGRDHKREETPGATAWVSFIRAVLAAGGVRSIGLLLHFYGGDYETEEISIRERRSLRVAELKSEYLLRIEEDVLYEFR